MRWIGRVGVLCWAGAASAVTVELEPGADIGALTNVMGPGDTFIFHAGVYELPGSLTWSAPGTEAAPVTIRSAGDGEVVLRSLDGGHVVRLQDSTFTTVEDLVFEQSDARYDESNATGFILANSSDITLHRLRVQHVGGNGFAFSGDNQRISLTESEAADLRTGSGIVMGCGNASCWTSDSTLANNLVHDALGDRRHGIELLPGGQGNVIRDNVVYNVTGVGIGVSTTEFGPGNIVEGNAVWDAADAGIRVAGTAMVRNNIVFRIEGNGIRSSNQFEDSLVDVVIANNTVVDTTEWGVRLQGWNDKDGMVFTNNAVVNPTGRAFDIDGEQWGPDNYIAGNVMTGLVQKISAIDGHFSPGRGYADFEDAEVWDFYPTPSSAFIGTGDASAAAFIPEGDFSDFGRDDSSVDVGAYEFVGAGNPGWTLQQDFKGPAGTPDVAEDLGGGCCGDKGSDAGAVLWPLLALFAWRRRRDTQAS